MSRILKACSRMDKGISGGSDLERIYTTKLHIFQPVLMRIGRMLKYPRMFELIRVVSFSDKYLRGDYLKVEKTEMLDLRDGLRVMLRNSALLSDSVSPCVAVARA
ncbi:hypothetical protein HAX54_039432 [Datura stramonium]|uniref:Uncharacterized protein n=1 Tax=Datura stramonium TaxID=4076 RepID=A0ABS8SIY9_DATST|nr:hypothetical protein [Datura stramonium]